jgi:hypothetical protein
MGARSRSGRMNGGNPGDCDDLFRNRLGRVFKPCHCEERVPRDEAIQLDRHGALCAPRDDKRVWKHALSQTVLSGLDVNVHSPIRSPTGNPVSTGENLLMCRYDGT